MELKGKIFYLLFFLTGFNFVNGQDINFSQFYETPLLRNPALAGIFVGDIRFSATYRNQWQSVTVPFQTMALSGEFRFSGCNSNSEVYKTIGILVTNDQAGDSRFRKTQVLPAFNLHIPLNSDNGTFLGAGISGGPVQQTFDPSKLYFDDQFVNGNYSPTNPTHQTFNNTNVTYWDLSAGVSYNSELGTDSRFYVGFGISHIVQPTVAFMKQNDIKLNRKYGVNAGLSLPSSDADKITIYGDCFIQGGNSLVQGGFLFSHDFMQGDLETDERKGITVGAFYRWADALIPVVKLEFPTFSIGVSYDVNISKLQTASQARGGTEITLGYKNFLNICSSSRNHTKCPTL